MDSRRIAAKGSATLFLLLAIVLTVATTEQGRAAATGSQRMVLAPGCYVLAPGQYDDVDAFCLDQFRTAPPPGSILSNAPPSMGKAVVVIGGKTQAELPDALARHIVQIEGRGDDRYLRIKNLGDDKIQICINAPTVVTGNGEYGTADLKDIYNTIARLLTPRESGSPQPSRSAENADRDSHAQLQQELWTVVNKADEEAQREASRRLFLDTLIPPGATAPPWFIPNRSKCAGQSDNVEICADR